MPVPGSTDTIVLLDYMDGPSVFANLVRVTSDGAEVWRATPPQPGSDAWTFARIEGHEVVANSWSGYEVRLDIVSGRERSRTFTK